MDLGYGSSCLPADAAWSAMGVIPGQRRRSQRRAQSIAVGIVSGGVGEMGARASWRSMTCCPQVERC